MVTEVLEAKGTVAIMQPYFLPYIGYFQLMQEADSFVIYDNIQYTKKGWINRNRFLSAGKEDYFSIPLAKDSDYLNVNQRYLAENAGELIAKALRRIRESYKDAPMFDMVFPVMNEIFVCNKRNLFEYILFSVLKIREYLEIEGRLIVSSTLNIEAHLKGQDKVLAICKAVGGRTYLNPIGGVDLYERRIFDQNNLELKFLKPLNIEYRQLDNDFIPWLSILDVLMFNTKDEARQFLVSGYELIDAI